MLRRLAIAGVLAAAPFASAQSTTDDPVIGVVGGLPLHASRVLDSSKPVLTAMAHGVDARTFRAAARPHLQQALQRAIVEHLLVADAERRVTPEERKVIESWMQARRRALIQEFGNGDPITADRALRESEGGLEPAVEQQRRSMLLQKRMDELVQANLKVTEADIESYFQRHRDRFESPERRSFRMIIANDARGADRIEAALDAGTPFLEIAASPDNRLHRTEGRPRTGNEVAAGELTPTLDDALFALDEGRRSPRLRNGRGWCWLLLERITPATTTPRDVADAEIRAQLESEQRQHIMSRHVLQLLERADMDPPMEGILRNAVDVASVRYVTG